MQNFNLFGEKVDISIEVSNFNVFRNRYVNLALNARKEFSKKYKSFHSIEQVLNGYHDICGELFDPIVQAAVNDLLANKILDANTNIIFDGLAKMNRGKLCLEIAYEEVEEKYLEILEDQQAKIEYRKARKQHRRRWVGGGFGIQSAVKGVYKLERSMQQAVSLMVQQI